MQFSMRVVINVYPGVAVGHGRQRRKSERIARGMKTFAALSLLSTALLAAQPPPAAAPRPGGNMLISRAVPDAAAVERGQKIFIGNCGFCHGTTAQGGDTGPDLVRSALALDDERGDKIGPVI